MAEPFDACELPQWSYDPRRHGEMVIPKPVPCGHSARHGGSVRLGMHRSIAAFRVTMRTAYFLAAAQCADATLQCKCCALAGREQRGGAGRISHLAELRDVGPAWHVGDICARHAEVAAKSGGPDDVATADR